MSYGPPFSPAELAARKKLERMFERLRKLYDKPQPARRSLRASHTPRPKE